MVGFNRILGITMENKLFGNCLSLLSVSVLSHNNVTYCSHQLLQQCSNVNMGNKCLGKFAKMKVLIPWVNNGMTDFGFLTISQPIPVPLACNHNLSSKVAVQ